MTRLVKNGVDLPERILHVNRRTLHPGIAVANVLKILAENNPAICLRDWGNVVLPAKVDPAFKTITIDGVQYQLRQNFQPKRDTSLERCLCLTFRPGHPNEEEYFILNPHPLNKTLDRLVFKCKRGRKTLSSLVSDMNCYCNASKLPCLQGIQII